MNPSSVGACGLRVQYQLLQCLLRAEAFFTLVRSPLSVRKEGDAGTLAGDGEEDEDSDGNGKEKGARRDRRSRDRCVPLNPET